MSIHIFRNAQPKTSKTTHLRTKLSQSQWHAVWLSANEYDFRFILIERTLNLSSSITAESNDMLFYSVLFFSLPPIFKYANSLCLWVCCVTMVLVWTKTPPSPFQIHLWCQSVFFPWLLIETNASKESMNSYNNDECSLIGHDFTKN